MPTMWMTLESLSGHLALIAAILASVLTLWRGLVKPLRDAIERLRLLDADMADLLWERLQQAHDEATARGWCSAADKQRLTALHRRYTARGRNHLASTYESDLLRLPEHPKGGETDV